ncbi:MAG: hypothetical protein IJK35_03155 [Oscillospiraceae bacterium]|nr:hypothetical protein [Oscillospiraceae bacterium]
MKREQLSEIIGNLDDRLIAEAYQFDPGRCGRSPERIGKMKIKRIVTFALAAALILALGVTGYAVYRGRVQDLVMKAPEAEADIVIVGGEENIAAAAEDEIALVDENGDPLPASEPAAEEPKTAPYDPLAGDSDQISLQGFAGSPEYQAALAWAEFQHNYDRDGSVLASVGNGPTPWTETYSVNGYHVYSQEMADTLEGIAAEYGLTLHSGGLQSADLREMKERFGAFCTAAVTGRGYYFADGTFQSDCAFDGISFQIRRCMKGVLDTVSLNVFDAEQYEQWEYTTACGETVLLALGPNKALILAESDQSFVVVNVLAGASDSLFFGADGSITAAQLEELADSFDFSIL